jgi:hypothetical protein
MLGSGRPNRLTTEATANVLSWPAAEVGEESEAQWSRADLQAELDREAREFGLADVGPVARYGPNGHAVEAVFVTMDDIKFEEVDPAVLRLLADAWDAVDPMARRKVHSEIQTYRLDGPYTEHLAAAESELVAWRQSRPVGDENEARLLRVVAAAAQDALDALILRDQLNDADFGTLYGPWAKTIDAARQRASTPGADQDAAGDPPAGPALPDEGFGPNKGLVRLFLAALDELAEDDFKAVTAAFRRQSRDDLDIAHEAVRDIVAADQVWHDRVKAAQTWVDGSMRSEMMMGSRRVSDRLPLAKAEALPPAVDAVTALVLGSMLDPEDGAILLAPWSVVAGESETSG